MSIILYPTDTLYALGVNALDFSELQKLFELKGRSLNQAVTWLVRDIMDMQHYAFMSQKAIALAEQFLPGQLTLVLPIKDFVPRNLVSEDNTVGIRISSDEVAQKVVADFMGKYDAPLTCTSANISGSPTFSTPEEIRQQFGVNASKITETIDDGPRKSLASTIVRVVGDDVRIIREGNISEKEIFKAIE